MRMLPLPLRIATQISAGNGDPARWVQPLVTPLHLQTKCWLLPLTGEEGWYEPVGRSTHSTAVVGESLFLWAGSQLNDAPCVHESSEKRAFLSRLDVFHLQRGNWEQQITSGTPPLGMRGYACVAVDSDLHYFGGGCGHDDCYHNSVHKLNTSSLQWRVLAPTTAEGRGPMKKRYCGMMAFKNGEEDFLFVVGGEGPTPSSCQPGAQYKKITSHLLTNEQHMFSLSTSEW